MSDLERRLRHAMMAAVEQPPPGLMEGVRLRHRRHLRRAAAGCVAAVAAIALAITPVAHALRGASQPSGPAISGNPGPAPAGAAPAAAPGTVLAGCSSANVGLVASGNLPPDWQQRAGKAGPLWFLDVGGHSDISGHSNISGNGNAGGKPVLYVTAVVITGVTPGSTVVVRVASAARPYLRFLYGPGDSLNAGTTYTMGSGESGVTFVMCPLDGSPASSEPITDYYGGLLVEGTRCVPVDVLPSGQAHPIRISLGACH